MINCYKATLNKSNWKKSNGESIQSIEILGLSDTYKTVVNVDWTVCDNHYHKQKVLKLFEYITRCITEKDKIIFHLSKTNESVIDIPIKIFQVIPEEET